MFNSFFPKPGPFFLSAFLWGLAAVLFWQTEGGAWLLHLFSATADVSRLPGVLCVLCGLRRAFCSVLAGLLSASLAALVHLGHRTDYFCYLVFGRGRRGRKRLVWSFL